MLYRQDMSKQWRSDVRRSSCSVYYSSTSSVYSVQLFDVFLLNIVDAPSYINGASVFIGQHVKRNLRSECLCHKIKLFLMSDILF